MINTRTNIVRPDPATHEWEVAGAIERWEERYRAFKAKENE